MKSEQHLDEVGVFCRRIDQLLEASNVGEILLPRPFRLSQLAIDISQLTMVAKGHWLLDAKDVFDGYRARRESCLDSESARLARCGLPR